MDPEWEKIKQQSYYSCFGNFGLVAILSIVVYFSGWLDNKSDQ